MSKPGTKILPKKIKEKSYLLYKIQQKHEHWKIPKCAVLIGAGCSHPVIPLGSKLITLCQQLCFIRDAYPLQAANLHTQFLNKPADELITGFIAGLEKGDALFDKYIKEKEKIIAENIESRKVEELKKIQSIIPEAEWKDFKDHIINDAKYGFWMDSYSNSPKERQRLIESLVEGNSAGGAYIILALMIEKGYISNILTTNFDDFINDTVISYTGIRTRFYADDELSQFISIYGNKPNIIKLHGDYRYANLKNTNAETFRLSNSMEEKLRELLLNLDLIVIGYNGADYSIMKVLQQVKSPNCELLWCGLDDQKVHWRVANLINNTENSWFIKTNGFDDVMKDFYLQFVQSPPDLRKKADERSNEITSYLQAFSITVQEKSTAVEKDALKIQSTVWDLFNKANSETNVDKKINLYNEIEEIDEKFKDLYLMRGYIYLTDKNDPDKAILDFSRLIQLDDQNSGAYRGRGWALTEKKDFQNAIQDLNHAVQLIDANPTSTNYTRYTAYHTRGYCWFRKGDFAEAIRDFDQAIKLYALAAESFYYLGRIYLAQNDLKNALEAADKAIQYKNNFKIAYELRVEIYNAMGEPGKAEIDQQKIAEL